MAFSSKTEARRGITTEEGLMKAEQRFQRDDKKADTNKDGKLSDFEKERADAVQKDKKAMKFNKGGMMADDALGYDEESGNPIPLGSSAEEVRDDIDVKISTGEFVLPADVVRYHGLKHIIGMIDEAKYGLMCMHDDGLIQVDGEKPKKGKKKKSDKMEIVGEEYMEDGAVAGSMYGMVRKPKIVFAM